MGVAVNPPRTPVTEGSSGVASATIPNVCKMPGPPAPFVPTPLPNIGKSGNSPQGYSTSVTIEGNAVALRGATFKSDGDQASQGTGGGLISSNVQGPTSFAAPGSLDTSIEGKAVQLLGDQMLNNCGPSGSPPNSATMMGLKQKDQTVGKPPHTPDIDCAENCKQRPHGLAWDDCDLKQLCAKVKGLNEKATKGELVVTPGANEEDEYESTKTLYKRVFKKVCGNPDSEMWMKDQFFDECAYEKWKNGDPPHKTASDPEPSVKYPKPREALNPDHVHDAALGGSLTDLGNLKWLSASVNKSIGAGMKNYNPETQGKIELPPSCKCDS